MMCSNVSMKEMQCASDESVRMASACAYSAACAANRAHRYKTTPMREMLMGSPGPVTHTRSHDAQFTRAMACSRFIEDGSIEDGHGDPAGRAAPGRLQAEPAPGRGIAG